MASGEQPEEQSGECGPHLTGENGPGAKTDVLVAEPRDNELEGTGVCTGGHNEKKRVECGKAERVL